MCQPSFSALPAAKCCVSSNKKRKRKAAELPDSRQAYATGDVSRQTGFVTAIVQYRNKGARQKKKHPCLAHLQLLREFHGRKPPLPHQFGLILFMSNLCRIESMHVIYQGEEVLRPDSTFLNGCLCSGVEMSIRSHYRQTLCLLNSR